MRRTLATFQYILVFTFVTMSGLLLELSFETAIISAIVSTAIAIGVIKIEKASTISPVNLSYIRIDLLLASYVIAVLSTTSLLYCFDFLSKRPIQSTPRSGMSSIVIYLFILFFFVASWIGMILRSARKESAEKNSKQEPLASSIHSKNRQFVIPDFSILEDPRAYDLAKIGLFQGRFGVPLFYVEELKEALQNSTDESIRIKAKKALDMLKKLETLPPQSFEYISNISTTTQDDISLDMSELLLKFVIQTNNLILTADPQSYKLEPEHYSHIITTDTISSITRNVNPKGDSLAIKIQRLGKEPKQGIGYLDDGTMVVVNGGGDYLGKTVRAQFLSQKFSTSGKIIFSNAVSDMYGESEIIPV